MDTDDRSAYRAMSDVQLIAHYRDFGPSVELCVVLAERLEDIVNDPITFGYQ